MRCKKIDYRTKKEAAASIVDRIAHSYKPHPSNMGIYYCYDCYAYHVTSRKTKGAMVGIGEER